MPASVAPSVQIPSAFRSFLVSQEVLTEPEAEQLELGQTEDVGTVEFGPTNLMGVAAAASRLGVHENTVRNWSNRGILKAVRLPGGHRRIDSTQVERVRSEMFRTGHRPAEDETSPSQNEIRGPFRQGKPEEGW